MPRLIGQRRSPAGLYMLSAIVVAIAAAGVLEYQGVFNLENLVQQVKIKLNTSSLSSNYPTTRLSKIVLSNKYS
ncbi:MULTISPECIES: hypothetical protein [unclassified Nostoc]|uniref:hypothetical protein n=1 Tax=unclassified Nostoc TaxID=2593658 RepID=UPI002AD387DC|nr:hypothetical protein [Nostoc sp. DedQUE03]MDZ7971725.1 hypothetical protein [Nostoc sp. DedQUE03]MDZ8047301.1 hypothetical protein [Nostoc sp. DedQUE02]